jgi:hypothetical protein
LQLHSTGVEPRRPHLRPSRPTARTEIREVLVQMAIYCGIRAASEAFNEINKK